MDNKKLVYRAGTIPYIVEDGVIKMMFMVPSACSFLEESDLVPQCAKGKCEPDEDFQTTAIREAKEELGLFVGNILLIENVGNFLGRTEMYVAKIKDKNMFGEPSFETSEVKWMTMEQFEQEGRILHIPVVQACYRKIRKIEGL